MAPDDAPPPAYYLGCPFWGGKAWCGSLFTRRARPADFLRQYAQVFDTVEGNTTFYGVPSPDTLRAWRDATPARFRFLLKFPGAISHDGGLAPDVDAQAAAFVKACAPLGERAMFWLQLPPWFDDTDRLARFLDALPDVPLAVEPRSPRLVDGGRAEARFDRLLVEAGADRAHFDTLELQRLTTTDEALRAAQRRKPALPRRIHALGPRPVVRYIGDPAGGDGEVLERWADVVAGWIDEGRRPLFFLHESPDDLGAPALARAFHARLRRRLALPPHPPWPGETEPVQGTLFDD